MNLMPWDPARELEERSRLMETAEAFQVEAELPGVKKEEEKGEKYHCIERSYGSFLRRFTLPANVDATQLQASFTAGVLNVMLPRSAQSAPRAIEVKVA